MADTRAVIIKQISLNQSNTAILELNPILDLETQAGFLLKRLNLLGLQGTEIYDPVKELREALDQFQNDNKLYKGNSANKNKALASYSKLIEVMQASASLLKDRESQKLKELNEEIESEISHSKPLVDGRFIDDILSHRYALHILPREQKRELRESGQRFRAFFGLSTDLDWTEENKQAEFQREKESLRAEKGINADLAYDSVMQYGELLGYFGERSFEEAFTEAVNIANNEAHFRNFILANDLILLMSLGEGLQAGFLHKLNEDYGRVLEKRAAYLQAKEDFEAGLKTDVNQAELECIQYIFAYYHRAYFEAQKFVKAKSFSDERESKSVPSRYIEIVKVIEDMQTTTRTFTSLEKINYLKKYLDLFNPIYKNTKGLIETFGEDTENKEAKNKKYSPYSQKIVNSLKNINDLGELIKTKTTELSNAERAWSVTIFGYTFPPSAKRNLQRINLELEHLSDLMLKLATAAARKSCEAGHPIPDLPASPKSHKKSYRDLIVSPELKEPLLAEEKRPHELKSEAKIAKLLHLTPHREEKAVELSLKELKLIDKFSDLQKSLNKNIQSLNKALGSSSISIDDKIQMLKDFHRELRSAAKQCSWQYGVDNKSGLRVVLLPLEELNKEIDPIISKLKEQKNFDPLAIKNNFENIERRLASNPNQGADEQLGNDLIMIRNLAKQAPANAVVTVNNQERNVRVWAYQLELKITAKLQSDEHSRIHLANSSGPLHPDEVESKPSKRRPS